MNYNWIESETDALIYIGDTMCSWCYGFAPTFEKFVEKHTELPLHLVMGGLRPNSTEKAIDMADFLKGHWDEITERTGQPFKFDILNDPDFVYNTEPASRAVVVARIMKPTIELDFFIAIQRAFYAQNKDTNNVETYVEIAKEFDLDANEYRELFLSEEAKYATKSDYQLSAEMGIKGFPSVVLKKGKEFIMLANGYRSFEDLEAVYDKVMTL